MSQLDVGILQEVVSRVEAAWDVRVFVGRRRGGPGPVPAAAVVLERVDYDGATDGGTVGTDQQTWRFLIVYVGRWSEALGGSIEERKIAVANLAIGGLMSDATLDGNGYNPRIEGVEFAEESEDPNDGFYSVTVRFAIDTDADVVV